MLRREKTEEGILAAFEAQLVEGGMQGLGINAVAKRAGVSKELIYRYFGGMPGLMLAWMQGRDYWSSKAGLLGSDDTSNLTPAALISAMLREQEAVLARDQAVAEVRRWELVERTEVGDRLRERREREARKFINRLDGLAEEVDVPAFVAVLLAGILYLSLRSKTEDVFLGVPLRTEEGWARIWGSVELMLNVLPSELRSKSLRTLECPEPDQKRRRMNDQCPSSNDLGQPA